MSSSWQKQIRKHAVLIGKVDFFCLFDCLLQFIWMKIAQKVIQEIMVCD